MNQEEVLRGIKTCVGKVVDKDPDTIQAEDRVLEDLGADSLDLLDLVFQLEQHFKIRIKTRDIERRAREELGDVPMEANGVYTPEALEQLREAMPEVPADELREGLRSADLPYRFRVATFARLVQRLMEEQHG